MSTSAIQCRRCGHVLAKRHHTGVIKWQVGIGTTMFRGKTKAVCPCGHEQVIYETERKAAA